MKLEGSGEDGPEARSAAATREAARDAARQVGAPGILALWDTERAVAWAAGDPSALRRLYAPGSRTGGRDAALLRSYLARGLRVTDMRTQLLSVAVRRSGPRRLVLEVTDRLVGGTAVGRGVRAPLPHDAPTTRLVGLRRLADRWVVSEVRATG